MGGGTGSETARRHEEPAVTTEASLTEDLDVDLSPADVWTLGQLIEADVASFPPGIAREILTGYRILQGAGYEPDEDVSQVELRGSGDTAGIQLPEALLSDDGEVLSRRVVLTEVTSREDAEPDDSDEAREVAQAPTTDGVDEARQPTAHVQTPAVLASADGEATQRLAYALERLADGLEDGVSVEAETTATADAQPRSSADDLPLTTLTVDWALVSLGLTVATVFVVAAGMLSDPVFAILGLALLGLSAFQSYPYLAGNREEGSP